MEGGKVSEIREEDSEGGREREKKKRGMKGKRGRR